MKDLSQEAILKALRGDWKGALQVNLKLLKEVGKNTDVLNRIAKCYAELGNIEKAKSYAKKVLNLDPFNTIAQKSLEKWSNIKNGIKHTPTKITTLNFLEEAGKTRIIPLRNISAASALLALDCGTEVKLIANPHSVTVVTTDGKYIGRLPDDIAARLKMLVKAGNIYESFVKCANKYEVKIFIREIKRVPHLAHIASFPAEKITYLAFTAPELLHNKKPVASNG
jgi:hypothetical protein